MKELWPWTAKRRLPTHTARRMGSVFMLAHAHLILLLLHCLFLPQSRTIIPARLRLHCRPLRRVFIPLVLLLLLSALHAYQLSTYQSDIMNPWLRFAALVLAAVGPEASGAPYKATSPQLERQVITPVVKGTPEVLGIVTNPIVNRDSCNSARFQHRTLWTCRDTQYLNEIGDPLNWSISSTAGWTHQRLNGEPVVDELPDGSGPGVLMYGSISNETAYFPLQDGQCNGNLAGQCGDDTRYAIWPDSRPLVAKGADVGVVTAYTWILNFRIRPDFSTVIPNPSVSLYKITWDPTYGESDDEAAAALPSVDVVNGTFWPEDTYPYGAYGHVTHQGVAYLYGKAANGKIGLAKVDIEDIEKRSAYKFWTSQGWADSPPPLNDTASAVPNASAGGQGTYYYSEVWDSFVWIGQSGFSVSADFFITTSPTPEGPWAEATLFYSGENGSADLSAYTLQAHPDMVPAGKNEIYLSYTKTDRRNTTRFDIYSTPLILVEWE
jgi:hypothetical protein